MEPYIDTPENANIIKESLDFAGLLDVVEKLPDGIHTKISKRFNRAGVVFSGGEMQKIAIARAFAHRRPIMIFDEATSSLDLLSASSLLLKSKNRLKNSTVIWITHRAEHFSVVDEVVYLENGEISERGKYGDLFKKRGKFYNFVKYY